MVVVIAECDAHVGHRHLPGADQRIAADQATDRAIADRDQEGLVGHRRQTQHAIPGLTKVHSGQFINHGGRGGKTAHIATHARGLAQQCLYGHVHRITAQQWITHDQHAVLSGDADGGIGAALPLGDELECGKRAGPQRQHVAFLRLVAPDLKRRHARLGAGHGTQVDFRAARAVRDRLRHRIGETPGAHVMNKLDRIFGTEGPASVDDFLRPTLHFRVASLHRGKIQILMAGTAPHGRGRTAAQADEHRRAAQHHERCAYGYHTFLDVLAPHVPQSAGNHDRLVIAARPTWRIIRLMLFERPEISADAGAPELVIERGSTDRSIEHDLKCRCDPRRRANGVLPGLHVPGNPQVRDRVAHQPGLRLSTQTGRALVPNLPSGTGGSSWKRRNSGWMVVGLHLDQNIDLFFVPSVHLGARICEVARAGNTGQHGRIVPVRR